MEKLERKLLSIGLDEKSVGVYLALLSLGKGNISVIARKAGLKRTSLYEYLDELLKRDLVYQTVKGKRIEYVAANPKRLLSLIEKERRELDRKQASAEAVIPELEELYSKSFSKPQVTYYEGKERIFEAYRTTLDTWQDVYSLFTPEHFFSIFSKEENHALLSILKEHGVKLHNLVESSGVAIDRLEMRKYDTFVRSKVLPEDLKFASDLLVTGDRLMLVSFENLIAVIVTDRAIADMQRRFLKFIWKRV